MTLSLIFLTDIVDVSRGGIGASGTFPTSDLLELRLTKIRQKNWNLTDTFHAKS